MTPAEFESIERLWGAALNLLINDARDFLAGRPDPEGIKQEAYRDLARCGPATRRLARFCLLDADAIARQFQKECESHFRSGIASVRMTDGIEIRAQHLYPATSFSAPAAKEEASSL